MLSHPVRYLLLLIVLIGATASLLVFAQGLGQTQDAIAVSLDKRTAISQVRQDSGSDGVQQSEKILRVAVAGVLSPTKTLEYYQDLLDFLGRKLGRRVTLILKPTYGEVNDLIRAGRVDIALVCSLAYVKGRQDFGMELLVAPRINGDTVYHSYLVVPGQSIATSLKDLKGANFAFTDPLSNSGYLVPVYQLSLLGDKPASFFGKYIFTYSHNNSITAIADKLIDGAAVDSLVYDQLIASDAQLASKTKIIARWGPYGIPPVVVSPQLDGGLKQAVKNLLLDMHNSEEGVRILAGLNIEKFVVVPDARYDSIREMKTVLGW